MASTILTVEQTPTITAGAYSSGDAVGGLLTFTGIAGRGKAVVRSVVLRDKADQKIATDLILAKSSFTATADNDAIAISSGDLSKFIGGVSIASGDYIDMGSVAMATKQVGNLALTDDSGDLSLYGQLITRGTPTYASTSDLTVVLTVELFE